jgi:class 3 adenylate cyclase
MTSAGSPCTSARVSVLTALNDVLVSSTLRDLVIGSGVDFNDRGAHQLKGVPGDWRPFALAAPQIR